MSLYQADVGAVASGTAFIALLSQRDLALQVPINYVTHPGVATSAACFPNGVYEDTAAAKCFSNLLASGFRRFELDLYWDVSRKIWSFCPVQLGDAGALPNATMTSLQSTPQSTMASLASGQLTGRSAVHFEEQGLATLMADALDRRQTSGLLSASSSLPSDTSTSSLPLVTSTSSVSSVGLSASASSLTSSSAASPTAATGTLVEVGPYSCTANVNFDLFTSILTEYLVNTETNLNATLRYLVMNLHVTASALDPTGSPERVSDGDLPHGSGLLGSIISSSMASYLYTPIELQQQRADLNAAGSGWFSVPYTDQPNAAYFEIDTVNGHQSSPDGWPSESFIEIQKAKRVLGVLGHVDPQLAGYNFSGDASTVFTQGYLRPSSTIVNDTAPNDNDCFFQPDELTLSAVNSSWATAALRFGAQSSILPEARILTSCGISPILNETLNNVTAAGDYRPYQAYVLNAVWPWAPGEPRNSSSTNNQQYRCAALNATQGQWQVAPCADDYYAACRVSRSPYTWQISDTRDSYTKASMGCPDNTTFSVPHTALENTYLLSEWNRWRGAHSDSDDILLWVNFNDLDASTCWVVGANTTCPYLSQQQSETREVVVPTVAAVIVFVLAALTVFVKCAANRQNLRRRRRRRDDDWDYEGVPS